MQTSQSSLEHRSGYSAGLPTRPRRCRALVIALAIAIASCSAGSSASASDSTTAIIQQIAKVYAQDSIQTGGSIGIEVGVVYGTEPPQFISAGDAIPNGWRAAIYARCDLPNRLGHQGLHDQSARPKRGRRQSGTERAALIVRDRDWLARTIDRRGNARRVGRFYRRVSELRRGLQRRRRRSPDACPRRGRRSTLTPHRILPSTFRLRCR